MNSAAIHASPSAVSAHRPAGREPAVSSDPSFAFNLSRLFEPLFNLVCVDFDFSGCELCDDASLHADLAASFERGDAPTARP